MKLAATLTIWLLAILLAGLLILRLIRGRPTLVHSAVGRRAIRIAALVLVFTGTSGLVGGKAAAQEDNGARPTDGVRTHDDLLFKENRQDLEQFLDSLPEQYAAAQMGQTIGQALGRAMVFQDQAGGAPAVGLYPGQLGFIIENAPHIYLVMRTQMPAIQWPIPEGTEVPAVLDWQALAAAAGEASQPELIHPAVQLMLWRQLQQMDLQPEDPEMRRALTNTMYKIRRQIGIYEAATRAIAETGLAPMRMDQRAWMSKAGPRPERHRLRVAENLEDIKVAAQEHYAVHNLGVWETEGLLELYERFSGQRVYIHSDKALDQLNVDRPTTFGRLDLIETRDGPSRITAQWLGEIKLPANALLRASDLPPLLSDEAKQKIAETIQAVLDRPERLFDDDIIDPEEAAAQEAAVQLERHLPLVAPMLADAIREHPEAYGTATLRTLLHQYQLPAGAVDSARQLREFGREGLGPELDEF